MPHVHGTEALRRAWTAVGDPFSKSALTRWRKTKLREYAATGNPLRIPFVETIVREFGSWPEALNQALPSVPTRRRRKTYE